MKSLWLDIGNTRLKYWITIVDTENTESSVAEPRII